METPIIFFEGKYSRTDLENFKLVNNIFKIKDIYTNQLNELYEIQKHFLVQNDFDIYLQSKIIDKDVNISGNWIYFPWNATLLHMTNQEDFDVIRTNRNKLIIESDEQNKLLAGSIGICGLSIGGNIATGLVHNGIANSLKLQDFDSLETSNLNRVKASLLDVQEKKANIISRQIYEINPYADISILTERLNIENLDIFFTQQPSPQIIFEAIDDFEMKIRLRLAAKTYKVPVIMVTNLGDGVLVDIERYDIDENLEIFNGLLGNIPLNILSNGISDELKIQYAIQLIGIEYLPTRVLETLNEINKTLVGRPQVFSSVSIGSGIACFIARKILLDEKLQSGRYFIRIPDLLGSNPLIENSEKRTKILQLLNKYTK